MKKETIIKEAIRIAKIRRGETIGLFINHFIWFVQPEIEKRIGKITCKNNSYAKKILETDFFNVLREYWKQNKMTEKDFYKKYNLTPNPYDRKRDKN